MTFQLSMLRNAGRVTALTVFAVVFAQAADKQAVQMTGAGATFPAPLYTKWFNEYQSIGNVQINYQPIGSGGGIKGVTEGTVDFGASDAILSKEQFEAFKSKNGGHGLLTFPTVLGAVVPSYNIPDVKGELSFTGPVLADIFLGKIKKWNDPALVKLNPSAKLPDLDIVVVHRSDGSGTTFCFTDYLSKVSPEWEKTVGRNASVSWPAGLGASKNDGVAGLLKQQTGALGYVELIYAVKNHLAYGKVQNKAGEFIKADLKTVSAAAAAMKELAADTQVSITDADGKGIYPVSTFTWLLVPDAFKDGEKAAAIKGFLKWAVTKGQDEAEALDYARLPAVVAQKVEKRVGLIK
jgi:phosphate transport system substrate-binding protein